MKKRVIELQGKVEANKELIRGLLDAAKADGSRAFNDDERKQFDSLEVQIEDDKAEIRTLEAQIKAEAAYARAKSAEKKEGEKAKVARNYSISKAFKDFTRSGRLEGLEAEMHQEAIRQNSAITGIGIPSMLFDRDVLVTSNPASAGNLIETNLASGFIDALAPKPKIFEAGATVYRGLQGNLDLAKKTSIETASWEGEIEENEEVTPTFDLIKLRPKRVGAKSQISKTLLAQQSNIADRELANFIRQATERAIDLQAINGSGTPITGILNLANAGVVEGGADGALPTWQNLVGLESEILGADGGGSQLAYLTTPNVRGVLKTTSKDAGSGQFIQVGNEVNGYPLLTSNLVPKDITKGAGTDLHAIIFGNFADLLVGNWANGYDIVIDPYTLADKAVLKVVVNSWWDIQFRHEENFAVMKDAKIS